MNIHLLENLAAVVQASLSPEALASGMGLLILSFSNRLGRVMDRRRALALFILDLHHSLRAVEEEQAR